MKENNNSGKALKILMVGHLYPPYIVGGYELRCSWIAEEMQKRGHKVCIVTSSYGCRRPRTEPEDVNGVRVYRILHDYDLTHKAHTRWQRVVRLRRQYKDVFNFIRVVDKFAPDVINWWHLGALCKGILAVPSDQNIPDVHWIEDVWMKRLRNDVSGDSLGWDRFWNGRWRPMRLRFLWRRIAALFRWYASMRGVPFRLKNIVSDHACFSCQFQRRANRNMRVHFKETSVIPGSTKGENFFLQRDWQHVLDKKNSVRLLYIASITESRKLDILLEALEIMNEEQRDRFSLTVVGGPPVKSSEPYYFSLKEKVETGPLHSIVSFSGQKPYDELPGICANHDVFVFTSGRPEGIPNAVLEAMLSGLCVLSTGAGGAGEIAVAADQPLYLAHNPEHLCKSLLILEQDREWLVECARRGQNIAGDQFSFNGMVDKFEKVLNKLVENHQE